MKNSNTEKINLRISEGNFYDFFKEINFQLSKSIKKNQLLEVQRRFFVKNLFHTFYLMELKLFY